MATKKSKSIDIEDASQLSILAFTLQHHSRVDWQVFLDRLKSPRSKQIAHAIAGETETVGDDTLRQAEYFRNWATSTANSARETARRPNRKRSD